jgi:Ca2+-binding RTX toxin-like protein
MAIIYGTNSGQTLVGGGADDEIFGWAEGNAPGNQGPAGDDDRLQGENGADLVSGGGGTDTLYGGDGGDTVFGGQGDDSLFGGNGADWLAGGSNLLGLDDGRDTIYGGDGKDFILGRHGNDLLYGGDDNDELVGERGNDVVFGGAGRDLIALNLGLGDGADTCDGGTGADRFEFNAGSSTRDWSLVLVAGAAGGRLGQVHYKNFESFTFTGGSGHDNVTGSTGADALRGGAGGDVLRGGAGQDLLEGETGFDRLTGGAGADFFKFTGEVSSLKTDQITDFVSGQDKIRLSITDFNIASSMATAFRLGTTAQDANDRLIYHRASGKLYADLDGAGGQNKILFAQLNPGTELRPGDFDLFGIA